MIFKNILRTKSTLGTLFALIFFVAVAAMLIGLRTGLEVHS